jgi:hypothetical protein
MRNPKWRIPWRNASETSQFETGMRPQLPSEILLSSFGACPQMPPTVAGLTLRTSVEQMAQIYASQSLP